MAKFTMVYINAEGVRGVPVVTSGRVRVMEFEDHKIRVNPNEMTIQELDDKGDVVKTLTINSLPDRREFHRDWVSQVWDTNPQVEIDITEK